MSAFPVSSVVKSHLNEFFRFHLPRSSFSSTYHLIMMNSNSMDVDMATTLWNSFECKICADGGANRLFDQIEAGRRSLFIPDFIVGDLDSVRPDVRQFYSDLGTKIFLDDDQDYNDFDKSLKLAAHVETPLPTTNAATSSVINSYERLLPVSIVALGAFGGRFDQEMSSIHALHKWKDDFDRIILLDRENAAFLLQGTSDFFISHRVEAVPEIEGPTCGLIPLAGAVAKVYTAGLHWNVNGQCLKMGELISSSNYVERARDTNAGPTAGLTGGEEGNSSQQSSKRGRVKREREEWQNVSESSTVTATTNANTTATVAPCSDLEKVAVTTSSALVWVWNIRWPPAHL